MLNNTDRPVQIIFAGKAHPRDNPGKDLIRQIVHTARLEPFRRFLVFLEDYDMNVARYMVQGVDVWLNTPLRPMEASGTSGMKAAANGALNLSIPDGWWAEGYQPEVGWTIGSGESYDDLEYQNKVESQALYDLIEKEVVPLFYDRGHDNLPHGWIAKMKAALGRLAPVFNTNRMVRQYAERFYVNAAKRWDELTGNDMRVARELSAWKRTLREHFPGVRVESVTDNLDGRGASVGREIRVEAVVALGALRPQDVKVELYYGPLDEDGQLTVGEATAMEKVGNDESARARYAVQMPCLRSGMTGYTVRVMPQHPSLSDARDMGLVRWV
jgi:starch phosphorylase